MGGHPHSAYPDYAIDKPPSSYGQEAWRADATQSQQPCIPARGRAKTINRPCGKRTTRVADGRRP
jgi:hypothetical protein